MASKIPLPGDHGLADAMARLPAAYRDILLLRYYNGYSVREISSMLHIKRIPHKSSFGEQRPLCKNI